MAINSVFKERHKKIHLVGIGGIGMSGIAHILLQSGFVVSGSDLHHGPEVQHLKNLGAEIFLGHHEENVGAADVVVYSTAINQNNPELMMAKTKNIPIIPRALMLAELMRLRCGIAIVGSHGKTTTTSLIGTLMCESALDPTVIIGGIGNNFGSNARFGKSQFMVTEADESDGTFLHLAPTIAVVTNIDAEHLDYYQGGIAELSEKVVAFLHALPFYGLAVLCSDDAPIAQIIPYINRRIKTYGITSDALYRAQNITTEQLTTSFDLLKANVFIARIHINMVGHHNVLNTLAAIAVLEEIGVSAESLLGIIKNFNGVKRRFSLVANTAHYMVIDDYAHHPTEIKAVLLACHQAFVGRKIRVLFQPHRYSRTRDLLDAFADCFTYCDSLVISDIYGAGENPILGISSHTLIDAITEKTGLKPHFAASLEDGAQQIAALTMDNDIVLTLGAGSITKMAPEIAAYLLQKFTP